MPSVFVFGLFSDSAGKTVVSSALARGLANQGLDVVAFKPRSGHSLWYQYDTFLKCKEEGSLFCEDVIKLREASKCLIPYEILNPVDALMSPLKTASFLKRDMLDRLYLLQSNPFMHLVAERYTICREAETETILCVNEEAVKSYATLLDLDYLLKLQKHSTKVLSLHSLRKWNKVFERFGPTAMRSCYQRVSGSFEYIVVEGFNDAVCPASSLSYDVVIGVAPGVTVFYDAKEFHNLLESMSKLGKNPNALRAKDVAKFLKEKEILSIPLVSQKSRKDYDKLSRRLKKLVAAILKKLTCLQNG